MGVTTGSGLTNRSDIIDTFMQFIIDEVGTPPAGAGAVISRDRSTGNVGADSVEQWLTMPADRVSSAKAQVFGWERDAGDGNAIRHNCTHLDFATASVADSRAFDRMDGQPSQSATEDNSATSKTSPNSNGFNIATPYLRHWFLTNPNFGALIAGNYAAGERTYVYMLVEVDVNQFRLFGHADVIQLGTWPTTAAGFYQFGAYIQNGGTTGTPSFGVANNFAGSQNGRPGQTGTSVPGGGGSDGRPNQLYQPDRDGMPRPWLSGDVFSFTEADNQDALLSDDPRYSGRDHIIPPASYSGVALRTPIYLDGTRTTAAQKATSISFADTALRIQRIGELPDVFFCNIRDLDPATIHVDGVEKFLVVPIFEKGDATSGNIGLLVRNPAL